MIKLVIPSNINKYVVLSEFSLGIKADKPIYTIKIFKSMNYIWKPQEIITYRGYVLITS